MKTNIEIDDDLLKEAMKITKIISKKKLINYALQEYVTLFKRNAAAMVKLKGNRNKKESYKTIFIKSELSQEEKYKRRLQLLSLQGKVKMFD